MTNQLIITQKKDTNILIKEALIQMVKKRWFVLCALYGFLFYTTWNRNGHLTTAESLINPATVVTVVLFGSTALLVFRIKKYLKGRQVTYSIDYDAITTETPEKLVKFSWEDVLMIKEKKQSYLIYYSKNAQSLIDKSQLNPTQAKELDKLFNGIKEKVNVLLKKDSL